jgi:hypothetical protein
LNEPIKKLEPSAWLSGWKRDAFWMLSGAVISAFIGPLGTKYYGNMTDSYKDLVCGGNAHYLSGLNLRKAAIEKEKGLLRSSIDLVRVADLTSVDHQQANKEFEAAQSCGDVRGTIQLAIAKCFGFGMKPNRNEAFASVRKAMDDNPGDLRLNELLVKDELCPHP